VLNFLFTLSHFYFAEDSSDDDDDVTTEQPFTAVTADTGCVEFDDEKAPSNERNFKEKRLNGILKKLMKDASSRL